MDVNCLIAPTCRTSSVPQVAKQLLGVTVHCYLLYRAAGVVSISELTSKLVSGAVSGGDV